MPQLPFLLWYNTVLSKFYQFPSYVVLIDSFFNRATMSNRPHPPDPKRFEAYSELKDGSGFTIKGCDFVFKYDRYGGWYDQFANYYGANGQPQDPPSDSEHSDHQSRSEDSYSDHEEDEFEREFGGPKNYEDEEDEVEDVYYENIAANLAVLNSYPAGRHLRVNFRNVAYISKRPDVFNYFKSKVGGILNVIFLENEKRQFNGNGYFVVEDIRAGEQLIRLEGQIYNNRDVHFSIPDVEEFLLDPVQNQELYPDFTHKHTEKKYITKGAAKTQEPQKREPAKEQKQKVQGKVEAKVEAKPKAEEKVASNPEELATYRFLKTAFPKKSSFKEWIKDNNLDHQKDIAKVQKIQGDQSYALVTMKRKVYNKLNGTFYDGTKIIFELQTK